MTIQKLTESDRQITLDFLKKNVSYNLFQIGGIYKNGFLQDHQQLWGDFNSAGELRAVLFKLFGGYIPTATSDFDVEGFAHIMANREDLLVLSGVKEVVQLFEPFLPLQLDWEQSKETFHFAELSRAEELHTQPDDFSFVVRKIVPTDTDVEKIITLSTKIEEFDVAPNSTEILSSLMGGRGYIVEDDNKPIAMARTELENPYSAMIVGVATDPEYRNQGLASLLMSVLCKEILTEGKQLCLFYNNPGAGAIYKRIGFKDIGFWSIVKSNQLKKRY